MKRRKEDSCIPCTGNVNLENYMEVPQQTKIKNDIPSFLSLLARMKCKNDVAISLLGTHPKEIKPIYESKRHSYCYAQCCTIHSSQDKEKLKFPTTVE